MENQQREVTRADLRQTANPFSSSRVDTPFQDHVDLSEVYQNEFELLKSILKDVKADRNQQSKAAVVIGEAGIGKTHLMIRLAKETLRTNRLLFIRQPNNAYTVLYHSAIYNCNNSENIWAHLQASIHPGAGLLQIQMAEVDAFSITPSIYNWRSPSGGSFHRQMEVRQTNLIYAENKTQSRLLQG